MRNWQATISSKGMPAFSSFLLARKSKRNFARLIQRLRKSYIDEIKRRRVVRILSRDIVQRLVFDPIRQRRIHGVIFVGDQIVILRRPDYIARRSLGVRDLSGIIALRQRLGAEIFLAHDRLLGGGLRPVGFFRRQGGRSVGRGVGSAVIKTVVIVRNVEGIAVRITGSATTRSAIPAR